MCVSAGVCTPTRSHSVWNVNTLPPGEGLLNYFCETDGKRDGGFEMAPGRREEEIEELELKKLASLLLTLLRFRPPVSFWSHIKL